MANTFTTNYSLVKSEIGGDNQNWGQNIHETLDALDLQLVNKLDDVNLKGFTSTAVAFTNTSGSGAGGSGTISAASGNLFADFKVGDKVRVSAGSGATSTINGTTVAPSTHTVTTKSSSNSITVSTGLDTVVAGASVIIAHVLEPKYLNGGPIVCAPPTGDTTTKALDVTGVTDLSGNVTLGSDVDTDTTTMGSKVVGDVLPNADGTYDLGSSTLEWQDLHVDGTANIDSLVADTVAISAGTISGVTTLSVAGTTISMTGYTIGSNGEGNRTASTSAATGGSDGDVHYEYA